MTPGDGPPGEPHLPETRISVRLKLAGFAAAVALLAGGLPAAWSILHARDEARARIDAQLEQLGSTIATGGLFADGRGGVDAQALRAFVKNAPALRLPLAWIVYLDASGAVDPSRSAVGVEALRAVEPALAAGFEAGPTRAGLERLAAHGPSPVVRTLSVRIRSADGRAMGRLRIGMSTLEADRAARAAFVSSGLIVAGLLLAVLVVAVSLAGPLVRPLRRLADAMARVAEGDLDQAVPKARRRDEIGRLEAAFNVMTGGLRQRERLRATLGRYVSDAVARRLLSERSDLDLTGDVRRVTVLFLDMRDFSSLAERLEPREVLDLVNAYFEIIVASVERYEGVINKFIGDAVMAVWGAPGACEAPEWQAVLAAWEIQRRVGELNWRRLQEGQPAIGVGIGINSGGVVAGNVGTARRMEYTVIGHEVNMAQRYESRAQPGQILVSSSTYERIEGRISVNRIEDVRVKGKRDAVTLYEVTAIAGEAEGGATEQAT